MKKSRKIIITFLAITSLIMLALSLTACKTSSLAKKLDMPLNAKIEISHRKSGTEYFIYWDAVDGAEKYSITIDGKQTESKTNSLNATTFMTEGSYSRVNIQALGNGITTRESDVNKAVLQAEKVSDILVFQLSDDGTFYSVSSYAMDKESLAGKIVMPDYFNGLPVEEVAEKGFFIAGDGVINPSTGVGCNNVSTSFRFPKYLKKISDLAFAYCTVVKDVKLPETVTEIGAQAFYSCLRLQNVDLSNVTSIGNRAFEGCKALSKTELSADIAHMGIMVFDGTNVVENSVGDAIILGNVLYGLTDKTLTEYTVPNNVTKFAGGAFADCNKLEKIDYSHDVEFLGDYTFYNCSALTSATISQNQTEIGEYDFYKCSSLTEISLPIGLKSIGDFAFYKCSSLKEVAIPSGVTDIGDAAFSETAITSIVLPEGLNKVGYATFLSCRNLTEVTLPETLEEIGEIAFAQCRLKSIVIPKSVKKINTSFIAYSTACKSIYYLGTKDEYDAIELVDTDSNGEALPSDYLTAYRIATIYYYSETEPQLNADGNEYVGSFWRFVDGVATPWTI